MTAEIDQLDVLDLARQVRDGRLSAARVVEHALVRIERLNPSLNCFTAVFADRARTAASRIDALVSRGENPGPLAGVPFGVKNLFDVKDKVTLAGSTILRERAPAVCDAALIDRCEAHGAILLGALNMDEFAYGFSTENEHYGATRNPHDQDCIAGGSSGGSAAAVAARLLPLALGSDTNGSVRVPASLCGVFGLKPTLGNLDDTGMYPFVDNLDCPGLFARTGGDLAAAYDALHDGPAIAPHICSGADSLRVAVLGGWFAQPTERTVAEAMAGLGRALGNPPVVELPGSDVARSAAFCISAAAGGSLHLSDLRTRAQDFDDATRDRFIAGALLPATVVDQAQRFRRWYREQAARLFADHDVLIAPATICPAPRLGETSVRIGDAMIPVRANLGLFTQPLSFIGLPVVSAPIAGTDGMPVGVQVVAAPGCEDHALRLAVALERRGVFASRSFAEPMAVPSSESAMS